MSDKRVRTSEALDDGINLRMSGITKSGDRYTGNIESWSYVALYGIHQELKKLNELLACPNFIGMPQTLRDIKRCVNRLPVIAKPRRPRAKK